MPLKDVVLAGCRPLAAEAAAEEAAEVAEAATEEGRAYRGADCWRVEAPRGGHRAAVDGEILGPGRPLFAKQVLHFYYLCKASTSFLLIS